MGRCVRCVPCRLVDGRGGAVMRGTPTGAVASGVNLSQKLQHKNLNNLFQTQNPGSFFND